MAMAVVNVTSVQGCDEVVGRVAADIPQNHGAFNLRVT
jgi:hypothetical protein